MNKYLNKDLQKLNELCADIISIALDLIQKDMPNVYHEIRQDFLRKWIGDVPAKLINYKNSCSKYHANKQDTYTCVAKHLLKDIIQPKLTTIINKHSVSQEVILAMKNGFKVKINQWLSQIDSDKK